MEQPKEKKFLSNENVSPPLFGNKFLDSLTRTHIAIPVSIFFIYAGGLIYWSLVVTQLQPWAVVSLFFGGWLFFTFVEYHAHKRLYHLEPTSEARKELSYKLHGIHHDFPKDKQRLAMPPIMSIILATTILGIFRLFLSKYAFATAAGFFVGYAAYLIVHYIVHIFHAPNNFLKALWTNHAIHHYQNDKIMFGVSSPLWDYVYGSLPPEWKEKKKKEVKVSAK